MPLGSPMGRVGFARARAVGGWLLAAVLLGSAVWFGSRGFEAHVLIALTWRSVAVLAGLVLLSFVVSGMLFSVVTRGFAHQPAVPVRTMTALVMASGLLNYIPALHPGLWGRAAYLRRYHRLLVRDSVVIQLLVIAVALAVLASVAGALVLTRWLELGAAWQWLTAFVAVGVVSVAMLSIRRCALLRAHRSVWLWPMYRWVDLLATAMRLLIAFEVLGVEVTYMDVVLMASGSLLVRLVGLTPNGLGLSEWTVSVLSAVINPGTQAAAAAAALLDRAVEFLVTCVCGGVSLMWLKRLARASIRSA